MAAIEKGCKPAELVGYWTNHWCEVALIWSPSSWEDVRNIFIVLGGCIGLWLAGKRTFSANNQANAALKQAQTNEASHNIDRFHKGMEMLISNSPFMAAAGARMLGGLARNSMKEFYPQVARILTSYIREISPLSDDLVIALQGREHGSFVNPPEQCAAVLIELSHMNDRRISDERFPYERINLRKSNLANIELIEGNFAHTIFSSCTMRNIGLEKCDLSWVNFYQCDLRGANFTDSDLTEAFFIRADLELANFKNVKLHGAKYLTYAQLSKARNVDPEFLAKLKADEEAAAAKATEENFPT